MKNSGPAASAYRRLRLGFSTSFLIVVIGNVIGCGGSKKPAPSLAVNPTASLSVGSTEATSRVFSAEEEIPATYSIFHGANGSVRVTLEVEGTTDGSRPVPSSLNDVLFKAVGDGRISLTIKRPWPEHPNGRVVISCSSAGEESTAEFEPELWFHKGGAIVTYESAGGEMPGPVVEGKEVVLNRYVARNLPHDIRVTLKAMFSKDPVAPRTKVGVKSDR